MRIKPNHNTKRRLTRVNILMTVALAAGLSAASVPAFAGTTTGDTVRVSVSTSKLENASGVKTVYQNLSTKAEKACRTAGRATLLNKRVSAICTANLLTDFVVALDAPLLTAYHQKMSVKQD